MTTRPATANVIKHEIIFTVGSMWQNWAVWVEHSGVPTLAMVTADRTVLRTWLTDKWRNRSYTGALVREIRSYGMHTVPPTRFDVDRVYPGTTIQGENATLFPPGLGIGFSLRTGLTTAFPKPRSGRFTWPGFADGVISRTTEGLWTGAGYTNIKTVVNDLIAAFTFVGNIGRWVVVSYFDGGTRAVPVVRAVPLVLPITRAYGIDIPVTIHKRRQRQQAYVTN